MCRENKDSSQLADGFHNVGFFWNYMYVILAFHVTVFKDTTPGRSKRKKKKKGAMWTDIRITVQYNRVQLFFHHRYYWNIYIYTYDTCCSKSLYQVVSVVLLDLLLNLAQSAKVNPTCQKKEKRKTNPSSTQYPAWHSWRVVIALYRNPSERHFYSPSPPSFFNHQFV